jgi:hypothetical protein
VPDQTLIPPNPEMAAMWAQNGAVLGPNGAPQANAPRPQQQGNPNIPAPSGNGGQRPPPQGQQDWFASYGAGEPTPEELSMEEPRHFQQPPQQRIPGTQQVPQQPQNDLGEIDAMLQGLPTEGAQQGVPQQQGQPQGYELPQQPQFQPQAAPQAPQISQEEAQTRAINELMGRDYAIPEADARRLISEPEAVLPRLAAQVHVNAVRDAGRLVREMLPQMVSAGVQQQLQAIRAEMEFFGNYPALNKPQFRPYVERAIAVTRQMNQQASREQVMREGAILAAQLIKGSFRQVQQAAPQSRAVAPPYRPAASYGGAPMPHNPQGESNIFSDLAADPNLFDF